eukprot:1160811-Pelagomonas_calceolata.AAC.14
MDREMTPERKQWTGKCSTNVLAEKGSPGKGAESMHCKWRAGKGAKSMHCKWRAGKGAESMHRK